MQHAARLYPPTGAGHKTRGDRADGHGNGHEKGRSRGTPAAALPWPYPWPGNPVGYSASALVSPVRMRTAWAISSTKILPSPMRPVLAAFWMASTTWSA